MIWPKGAQVFAEYPRTAGRDSQVMDACSRLEINPVAGFAQPVRKFGFEIIGNPQEPLVEAANFEGHFAAYGKISCHELLDPSRPTACKVELIVVRKINSFLPRLDYPTSHQAGPGLHVSIGVRL